jgi:hypothetical protein
MKPELTANQKSLFETKLREIVLNNTPEAQKQMSITPIVWVLDMPMTDAIFKKLDKRGKDKYNSLINSLKQRSI